MDFFRQLFMTVIYQCLWLVLLKRAKKTEYLVLWRADECIVAERSEFAVF